MWTFDKKMESVLFLVFTYITIYIHTSKRFWLISRYRAVSEDWRMLVSYVGVSKLINYSYSSMIISFFFKKKLISCLEYCNLSGVINKNHNTVQIYRDIWSTWLRRESRLNVCHYIPLSPTSFRISHVYTTVPVNPILLCSIKYIL